MTRLPRYLYESTLGLKMIFFRKSQHAFLRAEFLSKLRSRKLAYFVTTEYLTQRARVVFSLLYHCYQGFKTSGLCLPTLQIAAVLHPSTLPSSFRPHCMHLPSKQSAPVAVEGLLFGSYQLSESFSHYDRITHLQPIYHLTDNPFQANITPVGLLEV